MESNSGNVNLQVMYLTRNSSYLIMQTLSIGSGITTKKCFLFPGHSARFGLCSSSDLEYRPNYAMCIGASYHGSINSKVSDFSIHDITVGMWHFSIEI
jgi:hypothetical protein